MSSLSVRVTACIIVLLGVCFCFFCFYPTHANAPPGLHEEETGTDISRQLNTKGEATPTIDQGTKDANKPKLQPGDKKGASNQTSSPGTGQSEVTKNEPTEVEHKNPENTAKPDENLNPQQPPPAVKPASDTNNQLIKRVDGIENMVAITFDDGPFPEMTEQYLTVLDKLNVRATFFMIGQRIKFYPELAHQVVEQGSEIGSHSWQHASLDQLSADAITKDLNDVANQVQADVGRQVRLLRPPYGGRNDILLSVAEQLGYKVIIWDVDPRDWEDPPPEKIVTSVLEQVKPGSIIVMHEGRRNTLQALPVIIQKLRERGLEPVPVSEMLDQALAQPENSSTTGAIKEDNE